MVALIGMSAAHRALDRPDRAVACARQALAIARTEGFRGLEGYALHALAELSLDAGDVVGALDQARAAVAVHRDAGQRLGLARTLGVLGRVLVSGGDRAAAAEARREARALFAAAGVPDATAVPARRPRRAAGTLAAW